MYYIDCHLSQLDCKPLWGIILTFDDFAQGNKSIIMSIYKYKPF